MAEPWLKTLPTQFTPPPQGGGSVVPAKVTSRAYFVPRPQKVTVRKTATPKPTAPHDVEAAAQAYAQAQAAKRGDTIVNPIASKAAAAHQVANVESIRPAQSYSNTPRFQPHYPNEPIAGRIGNPRDVLNPPRPYYTDAHTHSTGAFVPLGVGEKTLPQEQTVQDVYKEQHPLGQAVIAGLAQAVPGVPTAERLAAGKAPTLGTASQEAGNVLGLAGSDELLAPVRAARAGLEASQAGGSITDAYRAARSAIRGGAEAALPDSPARSEFIKSLQDAGLPKKQQNATVKMADQIVRSYMAHNPTVGPEDAWTRLLVHSQYHDVPVKSSDFAPGGKLAFAQGAHPFAQEGTRPEIQNLAGTPSEHLDIPDAQSFLARQARNLVRQHRPALPDMHATPKKLEGLLTELRQRALDAEQYKDWYEKSGTAILNHVGGDPAEADKLAALIAVYSPQSAVYSTEHEWNNLDRALKAYDSYRETGVVPTDISISKSMKRDWQTEVATQIMQGHFQWNGLKINRFYRNFLQHIDPTKYEQLFGSEKFGTMDSWMQKAFHYATERYTSGSHTGEIKSIPAPNKREYAFMERANKIVADSLGWSPEEAQAAIWTSIKAEEEHTPLSEAGFHFGDAFAHRAVRESTKPSEMAKLVAPPGEHGVQKFTSAEARNLTPDSNYLYHETSNPEGIDAAQAIHAQETEGKGPGQHVWLRETPYPAYGGSHVYAIPRESIPQDLLGDRLALGNYATSGDVHFAGNAARETARVQIANEARPGDAPIFEGDRQFWNSLTPGEQTSYANEVFKVTRDGQFEKVVGLDTAGHHMGVGVWRGQATLGTANHVLVENLTAKEIADLNAVAAAKGIVQAQDSVSWGRPLARSVTGDNIYPGFLWRPQGAPPDVLAKIGDRIDQEFGAGWVGLIHGPQGSVYFVDFAGSPNFDARLQALLGSAERIEPISWEGSYVEDARAAQEGAWGTSYQDAIATHPKARELEAAVAVAQQKVAKIREDFKGYSQQRARDRYESALKEAASMMGKKVPARGYLGNKQDRREALSWIAHEARSSNDPEVQRVADTLDQAVLAGNSPDPETFFQQDNPLLDDIARAQGKPLAQPSFADKSLFEEPARTGGFPRTNADLQSLAKEEPVREPRIKGMVIRFTSGMHELHIFQGADISTAIHELGHAMETMLPREIRDTLAEHGITDEEKFARTFERYFYDGNAPSEALRKPMRDIAVGMAKVYKRVEDIPNAHLSPAVKEQFDAFFTRESTLDPSFAANEGAQWLAQTSGPGAPTPEPEEQLREGLKGARLRYTLQKKARSEELSKRAAKVDEVLRTIANPDEARAAAMDAMRGELPKIDFNGLKELDANALRQLKEHVQHHEALLPFQKIRLMKTLDQAVQDGRVPTPAEIRLIEHVFGKKTAIGIVSSTRTWGDTVINILNIPRSLMATADLSAALRQGLVAGTSHPVMWGKAWPFMLRSFKSPDFYEKTMQDIESDQLYPLALAAHVSFTDVGKDTKLIAHEEQFASDYAAQIPGIGRVVKGSARAYTAFLNKMRMDLFKHQIRAAMAAGRNVNDEKFLKSVGDVVNAATGRGTIHGRAEHILPALNTLMFSPRLMLSRINYLDPTWYIRLHPAARKEALRGLFATVGMVSTAVYLASRIPGVDVASTDPRNADFGKVKIGNTRLDLAAGFQQYIRLASTLATGETISSATGFKTKLGSKYGAPTRFDEVVNFLTGKAAPPISLAVELAKGKDATGQKVTPQAVAMNFFTPLNFQDARDIYKDRHGGVNGILWALGAFGLETPGVGVQTYGPPTTRQDSLKKLAKAAGVPPPTPELLKEAEHDQYLSGIMSHTSGWNARLQQAARYYTTQTGDHSFDSVASKKLPDPVAHQIYESIRLVLVGPGLAAYEHALKTATAARGH